MKSTERLYDNLMKDDFRKCKIDLSHAIGTVMERRIAAKKKEIVNKINKSKSK